MLYCIYYRSISIYYTSVAKSIMLPFISGTILHVNHHQCIFFLCLIHAELTFQLAMESTYSGADEEGIGSFLFIKPPKRGGGGKSIIHTNCVSDTK